MEELASKYEEAASSNLAESISGHRPKGFPKGFRSLGNSIASCGTQPAAWCMCPVFNRTVILKIKFAVFMSNRRLLDVQSAS